MKLNKCKCDILMCVRLLKNGYEVKNGLCPIENDLTIGDNIVYCYKREEGVE